MFVNGSGWNEQPLKRTFHRCFLPGFGSFDQAIAEEKIFKKSANQKPELPVAAMFVNRSGQNEQSLERTFHRCFLPRFTSFGWEVSEEKIKMRKVNGRRTTDNRRRTTDAKWWQKHTLPLARWAKKKQKDNILVRLAYIAKIPYYCDLNLGALYIAR